MSTKNRRSDGEEICLLTFTYDGKTHRLSAVDTARFFGVKYDTVYGGVARKGWTDQQAADYAAKKGNNYPRKKAMLNKFLYGGRLVP